jgi:hypothetical protein
MGPAGAQIMTLLRDHTTTHPPTHQGIIRLSKTQTSPECRARLNRTCFGRCLEALRVTQLGPLHNLSSVVEPTPLSPFLPAGSPDKRPCDCPRGYGIYLASNKTALWYWNTGDTPRVLNVSIDANNNGKLVLRHAAVPDAGTNETCRFVYDVAEGQCMGLKGGVQPRPHAEFPIWATILLAIAGVLLLSGMAFVVIKLRSPPPSSYARRRRQEASSKRKGGGASSSGGGSRARVSVKTVPEGEEVVASLTDPLLLGEEGKADGGS